ncbi:MAG: nickel pincer cofactor biosynthesis protein LarC [Bacillota bacterium]
MKKAFLQCTAGASGDMFLSALVDAGWDFGELEKILSKLDLPSGSYALEKQTVHVQGVRTTHLNIAASPAGPVRTLKDIQALLSSCRLPERVKKEALDAFAILAEAEAEVHGVSVEEVHFHEIGAVDTIIDIVGTLAGFAALEIGSVTCSPVRTGKGMIRCDHGSMPVPAPATAKLAAGIPCYAGDEEGEFLTPTGAVLIRKLASGFGELPLGRWEKIGYGSGSRKTLTPNYLRLFIGEDAPQAPGEKLLLLETNLDDLPGHACGYLLERIWEAGPLDVYLTPIQMKKNRPGTMLSILVSPEKRQEIISLLFREGATLGIRLQEIDRVSLDREIKEIRTPYGPVRVKYAYFHGKVCRRVPEYEDCSRIAKERNLSFREVMELISGFLSRDK